MSPPPQLATSICQLLAHLAQPTTTGPQSKQLGITDSISRNSIGLQVGYMSLATSEVDPTFDLHQYPTLNKIVLQSTPDSTVAKVVPNAWRWCIISPREAPASE